MADLVLWSVIRRCRENRGLTQTQAAEKIGIKQPTLSGLESGRQPLQESTLLAVAAGYGLTLRELLLEGLGENSGPPRKGG